MAAKRRRMAGIRCPSRMGFLPPLELVAHGPAVSCKPERTKPTLTRIKAPQAVNMTSGRQERKPCRLSVGILAILGAVGVVLMVGSAAPAQTPGPVVFNRYTGLAIDG